MRSGRFFRRIIAVAIDHRRRVSKVRSIVLRFDFYRAYGSIYNRDEIHFHLSILIVVVIEGTFLGSKSLDHCILRYGAGVHLHVPHHDLSDELPFIQVHQDACIQHIQLEPVSACVR